MKSTVIIPKDKKHKHLITIPIEIWRGLKLAEGDIIEIDVQKAKCGERAFDYLIRHEGD